MPALKLRCAESDEEKEARSKLMEKIEATDAYRADDKDRNLCPPAIMLDLRELRVDTDYQRPEQEYISQIADDRFFDRHAVGTITVSIRVDGTMYIIDGQQRVRSLLLRGITHWRCTIVEGLSIEEEAALFIRINGGEGTGKRVHIRDLFHAALRMGLRIAIEVRDAVEAAGMRLTLSSGCKEGNGIGCIGKLIELCDCYGEQTLLKTLALSRLIWADGAPVYKHQAMIHALLLLYLDYEKVFEGGAKYRHNFEMDAKPVTRENIISSLRDWPPAKFRHACHGTASYDFPYTELTRAINKGRKPPNIVLGSPSERSLPKKSAQPLQKHMSKARLAKKKKKPA